MRSSNSQIVLGPLIAFGVLVAILALGTLIGLSARQLPASAVSREAPDVVAAADILRTSGAHAAKLVLLDSSSHNKRDIDLAKVMHAPLSSSYEELGVSGEAAVSALIHSGVVREVWVVMPDSEWAQTVADSANLPQNVGTASMPVRRFDGALVHYTDLNDLPLADGPIVLLANAAVLGDYDSQLLGKLRDPAVARVSAVFGSGATQ